MGFYSDSCPCAFASPRLPKINTTRMECECGWNYGHEIINSIGGMREKIIIKRTCEWTCRPNTPTHQTSTPLDAPPPLLSLSRSCSLARIISIFQRKILLCFQKNNIYTARTWKWFLREPIASEKRSTLHSRNNAIHKIQISYTLKQFYRLFGVAGIHLAPMRKRQITIHTFFPAEPAVE